MFDTTRILPMLYASKDGQTVRIIDHLATRLEAMGIETHPVNLDVQQVDLQVLQQAPMILIAAPIRFGHHLPAVDSFLRENRRWLRRRLLALVSVNLTARKEGKNTPSTNPYLRKWIWKHKLSPALAAVFGGRLDYPRYAWWEKKIIQLIMKITGGPTNPDAVVDYTDWDRVDVLAAQIASFYAPQAAKPLSQSEVA